MKKIVLQTISMQAIIAIIMGIVFSSQCVQLILIEDSYLLEIETALTSRGSYLLPHLPLLCGVFTVFFPPFIIAIIILIIDLGLKTNTIVKLGIMLYITTTYISSVVITLGILSIITDEKLVLPVAYPLFIMVYSSKLLFFQKHLKSEVFSFYSLFPTCFTLYCF